MKGILFQYSYFEQGSATHYLLLRSGYVSSSIRTCIETLFCMASFCRMLHSLCTEIAEPPTAKPCLHLTFCKYSDLDLNFSHLFYSCLLIRYLHIFEESQMWLHIKSLEEPSYLDNNSCYLDNNSCYNAFCISNIGKHQNSSPPPKNPFSPTSMRDGLR